MQNQQRVHVRESYQREGLTPVEFQNLVWVRLFILWHSSLKLTGLGLYLQTKQNRQDPRNGIICSSIEYEPEPRSKSKQRLPTASITGCSFHNLLSFFFPAWVIARLLTQSKLTLNKNKSVPNHCFSDFLKRVLGFPVHPNSRVHENPHESSIVVFTSPAVHWGFIGRPFCCWEYRFVWNAMLSMKSVVKYFSKYWAGLETKNSVIFSHCLVRESVLLLVWCFDSTCFRC